MVSLVDRAARILRDHPAPALPLDELVRLVRGSGAVANPELVLHALRCRPDLFRILDPWRAAWRALSRPGPRWRCQGGNGEVGGAPRPFEVHPWWGDGRPWILGATPGRADPRPLPSRMKESLVWLGRTVDERSARDLARWFGMVQEGGRARRLYLAADAGARNAPERQSPSPSSDWRTNPCRAASPA